jgi:hypothetical protein
MLRIINLFSAFNYRFIALKPQNIVSLLICFWLRRRAVDESGLVNLSIDTRATQRNGARVHQLTTSKGLRLVFKTDRG